MEKIVMKPFAIKGEGYWNEAKKLSKGVLRIFPETMEIEVQMLCGCDPLACDLINFVTNDKDVRLLILAYQQIGRIKPYAINVSQGMSGREDIFINFYDKYGLEVGGKHLMHITCANKMDGIKKMYIGDFAEAVYAYGFCLGKNKTTGRYIKPYFAPEHVSSGVHKII